MDLASSKDCNATKKQNNKNKKRIHQKQKIVKCRKRYFLKYMKNYREKNKLRCTKYNLINKDKMKILRKNKNYSLAENKKNILRNSLLLKNKNYKLNENLKKKLRISLQRESVNYKANESIKNINRNKLLRNIDYIKSENLKNSERNKRLRENDDYNFNEKYQNNKRIKMYCQSKEYVYSENKTRISKYKKYKTEKQKIEKIHCQNKLTKQVERLNEIINYRTIYSNKLVRDVQNGSKQSKLILNFIKNRIQGPDLTCICCDNLFFRKSIENFNLEKIKLKLNCFKYINVDEFVKKIVNVSSEFICKTCLLSIFRGKIPDTAATGSIKFPNIPSVVKSLSPLEERMVAPYISFMQIMALQPYALNSQLSLKGSIVNISVDINEMVKTLPRNFNSLSTIQIKLKRHVEHKSDYMYETVRPHISCEAIDHLKDTPLYTQNGIIINKDFFQRYDKNIVDKTPVEFIVSPRNDSAKKIKILF